MPLPPRSAHPIHAVTRAATIVGSATMPGSPASEHRVTGQSARKLQVHLHFRTFFVGQNEPLSQSDSSGMVRDGMVNGASL